jgi:hypothetical protein
MELIACTPKMLPRDRWIPAAKTAVSINPMNHAPVQRLAMVMPGFVAQPAHLAVLVTKYWKTGGVHLTVGFLDNPEAALRKRIIQHMNAWSKTANVKFSEAKTNPDVRIARNAGDGYWSYLGTDILHIDADQPTMNLDSFTMNTPESEFHRVVRHETGHTMGFPHEHMRAELVAKIDRAKAVRYFGETQGWDENTVVQQVLTPIEQAQILATPTADVKSVMCYQIPGSITKDGKPIIGGKDIDRMDFDFASKIYPKTVTRPQAMTTMQKRSAAAAA